MAASVAAKDQIQGFFINLFFPKFFFNYFIISFTKLWNQIIYFYVGRKQLTKFEN